MKHRPHDIRIRVHQDEPFSRQVVVVVASFANRLMRPTHVRFCEIPLTLELQWRRPAIRHIMARLCTRRTTLRL